MNFFGRNPNQNNPPQSSAKTPHAEGANANATDATGILIYTTKWCSSCWRAKQVMDSMNVDYTEIDISYDPDAAERVMAMNRGYRSVPTIIFPDGSHLTEPQTTTLVQKLEELAGNA